MDISDAGSWSIGVDCAGLTSLASQHFASRGGASGPGAKHPLCPRKPTSELHRNKSASCR
jgi:hypothetical protein